MKKPLYKINIEPQNDENARRKKSSPLIDMRRKLVANNVSSNYSRNILVTAIAFLRLFVKYLVKIEIFIYPRARAKAARERARKKNRGRNDIYLALQSQAIFAKMRSHYSEMNQR